MINETSIALLDGSGYLAETAVYHELHCIVRLSMDSNGTGTDISTEAHQETSEPRPLLSEHD